MIILFTCGYYAALNNFREDVGNIQPTVGEATLNLTTPNTENQGGVFLHAAL